MNQFSIKEIYYTSEDRFATPPCRDFELSIGYIGGARNRSACVIILSNHHTATSWSEEV